MARVTSCGQCGAPHRPPHGVTRFRCDFCGTQNLSEDRPDYEELVSAAPVSQARAEAVVRREMLARGLEGWQSELSPPRWLPLWQAISRDGEEEVFAADPDGGPLDARLGLPAVPLVSRDDERAAALELPEAAPVDARAAEQASRSLFADTDFEPRVLRLLWLRVFDVSVRSPREERRGLFVAGTHRLFLPGNARPAVAGPLRPHSIGHYAVFLTGGLILVAVVPGALGRAVAISAWAAATLGFERWWRRIRPESP